MKYMNITGLGLVDSGMAWAGDPCGVTAPAEIADFGWACTRPAGHDNEHVASNDDEACFIWEQS